MVTTHEKVNNQPAAHALLRAAHDNGYRFPAGFPGFTSTIEVVESTAETTQKIAGTVTVSGPRATTLTTEATGDLATWAEREVASIASHRWPTPYEEGDGRWTLTTEDDPENALGQLIVVHDDPFTSRYRVRNGSITQVIRTMGPTSFTISMQQHQPAAGGTTLPAAYTVSFWDASGRLTRTDSYSDTYTTVDGATLPAGRRVLTATDDGFVGRDLTLSDIKLLDTSE
ncbi:MAG: DUF3386 domain-containing protein [Thermomicrobiales bacterium]|nr:DUF3386 domain-containing protein [Thermomicrobiales bacterium]